MPCGFKMHKKNRKDLENQDRESNRINGWERETFQRKGIPCDRNHVAKLKGKKINTTETYHAKKEGASRHFHWLLQLPAGQPDEEISVCCKVRQVTFLATHLVWIVTQMYIAHLETDTSILLFAREKKEISAIKSRRNPNVRKETDLSRKREVCHHVRHTLAAVDK